MAEASWVAKLRALATAEAGRPAARAGLGVAPLSLAA